MSKAASKTGLGPTAVVAIEQFYPENKRIIRDDLANRILPFSMRLFLKLTRFAGFREWMIRSSDKKAPGVWGGILCRKRYIDEKLLEALTRIQAVLNLGAGFDSRAFRLPGLADFPYWELDQHQNIDAKKKGLLYALPQIPDPIHLIPIDFDKQQIKTILDKAGYRFDWRTFIILEGVTQYLAEDGIRSTFSFLSGAARGSRLVFTYVVKDFISGKLKERWPQGFDKYVLKNVWLFGLDPAEIDAFLANYGWRLIEDTDYGKLADAYINPTGRSLKTMTIERIVYAEKI